MRCGFFQLVATLLLSTIVAAAAITVCGFYLSPAPAPAAGCHHNRIPIHPQPSDHRCCGSDHRAALVAPASSPRPGLLRLKLAAATGRLPLTRNSDMPRLDTSPSGNPPALILRV